MQEKKKKKACTFNDGFFMVFAVGALAFVPFINWTIYYMLIYVSILGIFGFFYCRG